MSNRRSVLTGLGAAVAVSAFETPARAQDDGFHRKQEVIAVLGTGHFGGALGKRVAALGHRVVYGSRTPESARVKALVQESGPRAFAASQHDAAAHGSIVVFAVPWTSVKEMLPSLGNLSGKLIIDPMIANPRVVNKLPFPPDPTTSAAEQLQASAPGTHVVSAFSTIWYGDLANPARAGGPISVPLAGDDRVSNKHVAGLIADIGLDPVIVGNLTAARYLESILWMEVACNSSIYNRGTKKMFEIYMRRVPL